MDFERVAARPAGAGRAWPPGWRRVLCHTHTHSGRADHGGPVRPPESYARLAAWCVRLGIDALGMGSPYTPASAETYHRYDGPERDRYYAGEVERGAVLHQAEIAAMLAGANAAGGGRTLFYLDNETPKGRYGHLWWVGYRQAVPAWHDYDQPYDRWMLERAGAGELEDEPMPYERRPYLAVLAEQRAGGALGVWAHPTSWWPGERGQFVTNIAAEMPAHALAMGGLDGLAIMGYQPHRPEYLAIWFELLDRGLRVPGVAEMDVGLSDPSLWDRESALLTHALAPGGCTVETIAAALSAGRVFAGSGPFVDLEVDGRPTGSAAPTSRAAIHRILLTALPRPGGGPLDRVELIGRGGRVLWSEEGFAGGALELRAVGLAERGYLVARVLASLPARCGWREPSQVAVTGPVYLHPPGAGFEPPARTRVTLSVDSTSPFAGGEARFEAMDGALLGRAAARPGKIVEMLPASGRLTLTAPDGRRRTDYLLNANPALLDAERYLYRGRFLIDFPSARPGEVPTAAWRLDAFARALNEVRLDR